MNGKNNLEAFHELLKTAKFSHDIPGLFREAAKFVNLRVDYEKFENKLLFALVNNESIIFFTETLTIAFMVYKTDVIVRISRI